MKKPRRPFSAYKAAALAAYNRRNKVLRVLGYASYAEYLASPLWAEIRERKLASVGRVCFACGKPANQVHHGDYDQLTLEGPLLSMPSSWDLWLELANLYAVCKKDHEWSEHFAGEKLPPEIATQRLKNRRKKNRLDEAPRAIISCPMCGSRKVKAGAARGHFECQETHCGATWVQNLPVPRPARLGPQERKAREMEAELNRLLRRDE